ncbi:MAG: hypothetical protein ACI9MR_002887 [Myxococcota bacterium]
MWALLLAVTLACAATPDALGAKPRRSATLTVTGVVAENPRVVRRLLGRVPRATDRAIAWAAEAEDRVSSWYNRRGYTYVRVWTLVIDGHVRVHIDEGRITRIIFDGGNAAQRLLWPMEVELPNQIYRAQAIEETLTKLRLLHGLRELSTTVTEQGSFYIEEIDQTVPARTLTILSAKGTRRPSRLGFDVDTSARWGFLVAISGRLENLATETDKLEGRIAISVPAVDLVREEAPKFTWQYGEIGMNYRFGAAAEARLAFELDTSVTAYFNDRKDLGVEEILGVRGELLLGIDWTLFDGGELQLAIGGSSVDHVKRDRVPDYIGPLPVDASQRRFESRLRLKLASDFYRTDLRNELTVAARAAVDVEGKALIALSLNWRLVASPDGHFIIWGGRAISLLNDIEYWDEPRLGNGYLTHYPDDKVWLHHAVGTSLAWRFPIVKGIFWLGVFEEVVVFGDRRVPDAPLEIAHDFGPSAHFLLSDYIALDIYAAFAFRTGSDERARLGLSLSTTY